MPELRIGVDATGWANERGYGRYAREIVGAMARAARHELVCFLDERSAASFTLQSSNVRRVVVAQRVAPTLAASAGNRRSPADMLRLTRAVRRERVDVFYSPSVYGYFPLPPGLPAVVTIHDAIAERFPELTLPSRADRLAWRTKVKLALWQAKLVLTVSSYAAREVMTHLGVKVDRLRVTLEGVADVYRPSENAGEIADAAARAGIPAGARWFMYVGGFGPHKHVPSIVRAHARAIRGRPDSPMLVLAGPQGAGFHEDIEAINAAIRECGTAKLVKWAGYLPDEDLRHLHSGAVALVLISASEGFGLPAVEAARCGTPVIATTESPLREILPGGGIFVAPGDEVATASAMERLLNDEPGRREMGARALEKAGALSWDRSARVVLEALEEAASVAEKMGSNAHVRT